MKRLAVLLAVAACEPKSQLVQHPTDPSVDATLATTWAHEIHGVARDGDWILSRRGEEMSYASIYDARHDTVIEAGAAGVREIPLTELLGRERDVIVVRPNKMTAADEELALARARSEVGAKHEGSELVYWASQTEARNGAHDGAMTAADLMQYGEVIYWSGNRTVVIK